MAITTETLQLAEGMRVSIAGHLDYTTRQLVRRWSSAWTEIAVEWEAAVTAAMAAADDGAWPTRIQLARLSALQRALDVSRDALTGLADHAAVTVTEQLDVLVSSAQDWQERLAASQLPPPDPNAATAAVTFNRVDPHAISAIVARATEQVTQPLYYLAPYATEAMKAEIIRGVAVGDNPRAAAARMVARVQGRFNGGLNRALVIARTEMIDAHRAAAAASDAANHHVIGSWIWLAKLDARTCPACWSKHGNTYPISAPGPLDHQQGRCARMPKTKSWRDLGFDLDEPPDLTPDARDVFTALPDADQRAVMGPARLAALRDGSLPWAALATRRETPGWRPSYAPIPVSALTRRSA